MDVGKETTFCVADWQVDPASGRYCRHGNTVKLEPRVMDVLVYLAGRPEQVIAREELEAARAARGSQLF